ncbi:AI-2E family transporter [Telluria aromaticivorans]|uniref:AI-2E family transporter n=1 Tax=Telluria aromaticivorans TaxID=2725995 RepID=A0A7Y2P2G4_9BURK|nr:AI-2E family transporter [Telluria aromaticivorans]NNG25601.1 AI-2E family transporter [Telluria aromaticivorans]
MEQRAGRNYPRIAIVVLLTLGCLYVLRPFLAAIVFAACVVISSWPLYLRLLGAMKGRSNLAALTMTMTLTLLVIIPLAMVAYNLADDVAKGFTEVRYAIEHRELAPPPWVREIPLVGESIDTYLRQLVASRDQMIALAQRFIEPARRYLLAGGLMLGTGVVQLSLAAFVSFFFYRDGKALLAVVDVAMQRMMGEGAESVSTTVSQTVRGVMYGMLGTALAQAVVAAIGFTIAGVPAVPLLSVMIFVSSLIPVGPPIIWGGAAIWLFLQGETGWGIFMVIWGTVLISGVDNIVRPMLISRGSSLPFLLTLLGVLGGVIAFGFVGMFIGPTLLAVGYSLMSEWTGTPDRVIRKN